MNEQREKRSVECPCGECKTMGDVWPSENADAAARLDALNALAERGCNVTDRTGDPPCVYDDRTSLFTDDSGLACDWTYVVGMHAGIKLCQSRHVDTSPHYPE